MLPDEPVEPDEEADELEDEEVSFADDPAALAGESDDAAAFAGSFADSFADEPERLSVR